MPRPRSCWLNSHVADGSAGRLNVLGPGLADEPAHVPPRQFAVVKQRFRDSFHGGPDIPGKASRSLEW
jgi:hypothetical protein